MSVSGETQNAVSKEFLITRLLDAPRDVVWKAHTDFDALKEWWGPKGFTWDHGSLDLRPGGMFHYGLRSPTGEVMWGKFIYREIVPPQKIVFVDSFSDEKGGVTRHPWSATWPLEMLTTTIFEARGDKTLLTLTAVAINASGIERKTFEDGFESMKAGFGGTLDQLTEYLAKR